MCLNDISVACPLRLWDLYIPFSASLVFLLMIRFFSSVCKAGSELRWWCWEVKTLNSYAKHTLQLRAFDAGVETIGRSIARLLSFWAIPLWWNGLPLCFKALKLAQASLPCTWEVGILFGPGWLLRLWSALLGRPVTVWRKHLQLTPHFYVAWLARPKQVMIPAWRLYLIKKSLETWMMLCRAKTNNYLHTWLTRKRMKNAGTASWLQSSKLLRSSYFFLVVLFEFVALCRCRDSFLLCHFVRGSWSLQRNAKRRVLEGPLLNPRRFGAFDWCSFLRLGEEVLVFLAGKDVCRWLRPYLFCSQARTRWHTSGWAENSPPPKRCFDNKQHDACYSIIYKCYCWGFQPRHAAVVYAEFVHIGSCLA